MCPEENHEHFLIKARAEPRPSPGADRARPVGPTRARSDSGSCLVGPGQTRAQSGSGSIGLGLGRALALARAALGQDPTE